MEKKTQNLVAALGGGEKIRQVALEVERLEAEARKFGFVPSKHESKIDPPLGTIQDRLTPFDKS